MVDNERGDAFFPRDGRRGGAAAICIGDATT